MKTNSDKPAANSDAGTKKPTILSDNLFPVIGIGASAGGLEAFIKFIRTIPVDSGMAYVLVQHLDPRHESLLPGLLQKVSMIPVVEISDEIKVEPDHIYIIPSNKMLIANDGILELSPRKSLSGKRNLPIDLFFNSLAEVHQAHAIGIVLSGSASDGTQGLKAIKANGGICFAQDESSAAYDSMPKSAVDAGVVDFVLPPDEMMEKLLQIRKQIRLDDDHDHSLEFAEDIYKQILFVLRIHKKTDFTYYKQSTIRRRISRRMVINKFKEPQSYLDFLKSNEPEQEALFSDLLIPVTSFFRDPKVFEHLCSEILPRIVNHKDAEEPIRLWVAGCSTGEEVYSLAICLHEMLGEHSPRKWQIFATDISEQSIIKARNGIYSISEMDGISQERIADFFIKSKDNYQVVKKLRENCVFAVHNFLKDPPFGKIDLISCRNVLIYLEAYLQKKTFTVFHYALVSKGYLLLGSSESVAAVPLLFEDSGSNLKFFISKDNATKYMAVASTRNEKDLHDENIAPAIKLETNFQRIADEVILNNYMPPSVVVNESLDIVQFRGDTHQFLEQGPGKPSHNLLKMAMTGLSFELRSLVQKAKKEGKTVIKENIMVGLSKNRQFLNLEVVPLPSLADPHYLVVFRQQQPMHLFSDAGILSEKHLHHNGHLERIAELESELAQNREDIRDVTEEQDADNEKLQTVNEELMSSSEELQSLNEELETSKEELQSSNEELQGLNVQLMAARAYAESIVSTTREPLLVLDNNLRVRTANNAFFQIFNVRKEHTIDRLLTEVGNGEWNIPALNQVLSEVLPGQKIISGFEIKIKFPGKPSRIVMINASELKGNYHNSDMILLGLEDITDKTKTKHSEQEFMQVLQATVEQRTKELSIANESLQKQNQEIMLSHYNKRFLVEFAERFSGYKLYSEFFNSLVQYISDLCKLDHVWVGKLEKDDGKDVIHTFAFSSFGKLTENIRYSLEGEPCEEVILGSVYAYPQDARKGFPGSWLLKTFRAEGYIGYPLYDSEGKSMGILAVMHSSPIIEVEMVSSVLKIVTKRAEMELERIKNEQILESNNAILKDKNEQLEKMNHELESFNYISSHDLQEPLRKIQTYASRILDTEIETLSETGRNYFQRMQASANRMQRLIEDLLAYSRTNIIDRIFELTDLNKLVDEIRTDMEEHLTNSKAVLKVEKLDEAFVNPFLFSQLICNLMSNAVKFTKPGEAPFIEIKSCRGSGIDLEEENDLLPQGKLIADQNYIKLTFSDHGIGFHSKYQNKIFEIFQRLHGREKYAGTGIGLAIVKKIAENHHGWITASGEPGVGARFDVYVPG